jgi:phosphoribosylformylglycinamidine synthase
VLRLNRQLEFVCRDVTVTVERADTPFTRHCMAGDELVMPVKHGEGNWFADDAAWSDVEALELVVLRYAEDVNGSLGGVAGVVNEARNVMGLMPHPEHAVDPLLGPVGGAPVLAGLVEAACERQRSPTSASR